jgi:hypothetical protein
MGLDRTDGEARWHLDPSAWTLRVVHVRRFGLRGKNFVKVPSSHGLKGDP